MKNRPRLVPELLVTDLAASLRFYVDLVGFAIRYDRPEQRFAYIDLNGAHLMLEERSSKERQWETASLEAPLGRGINFEIGVDALDPILDRIGQANWPLFMSPETAWYRTGMMEAGQRQFLVQDPDGYLLRLAEDLGERTLAQLSLQAP